ncbi:Rap1a/Tai family immunity protein [Belnapia moabensis]|uniref:Rap1a/Tai family immunity protein n=1 Tax=Belnapia moabensis TaxID=365533 RepID=UPI0038CD9F36
MGLLDGIIAAQPNICPSRGVTTGQMIWVVLQYVDARPHRLHERLSTLAQEAFQQAFPCR